MKIKKIIIFFVISIIPIQTVRADTPTFENTGWKDRKKYAILLMPHIKKIDRCLPDLTPSEKNWLNNEINEYEKNNNIRRFLEVKKNQTYKINKIKELNKVIINALTVICNQNLPEINEVKIWLIIADSLMESEYWNSVYDLTSIGKIEKKLTFDGPLVNIAIYDKDLTYYNNGILPAKKILQAIYNNY
jgi:hypothetical protein